MSNKHEHLHDENCTCGCGHDHEKHHHHDHEHGESCSCGCGHDHDHNHHGHEHDESCACGQHEHEHDHSHSHEEEVYESNEIYVETHLHEDARVVSGRLSLTASYDTVRTLLSSRLEEIAKAVIDKGGIVGHIKASCTVKSVDMFSVTDTAVSVKTAPEQEIVVKVAAIVFLVEIEEMETLIRSALEVIRDCVHKEH